MMYQEEDFIQLSALQHYMFCPRQCGLIHVEDIWRDNLFTVLGGLFHEKVDTDTYESRGNTRIVRGLRIHSRRLGLSGKCDVVEFYTDKNGITQVIPVEFKVGQPKENDCDRVQLCAQVLCLEEMLNRPIHQGAFFYGKIRRRQVIEINQDLRQQTNSIIQLVHEMVRSGIVPAVRYSARCRNCSLLDVCQPKALDARKLNVYMKDLYTP